MKEDIETALADYRELVTIETEGNFIVVRVKGFIRDKEKWNKINEILRSDFNGKWVGGIGKNSHWKVGIEQKKGNNGTFASVHCPFCGKTIDVSFKPRKEA